jgi:hypothetical protein
MRDVLGLVAGYGLLTITGDEHKQLRKAMNPAFAIPNLMAREWNPTLPSTIAHRTQKPTCTTSLSKRKRAISLLSSPSVTNIYSLIDIMKTQIKGEAVPAAGKIFSMYEWSTSILCPLIFSRSPLYV